MHTPDHAPFLTTHWSLVFAAGQTTAENHEDALNELCRAYWPPLYAFLRREGRSPEQAADLTQGFFALMLERGSFGHADPLRGRFRTFLLTALKRYATDQFRIDSAQKRGGGREMLPLDTGALNEEEAQLAVTPIETETPEHLYLRRWASALLDLAVTRTREDYGRLGQTALFDALKASVWGTDEVLTSGAIAAQLGLSDGSVRTATTRLRERFRTRLRSCVRETLSPDVSDHEIDAELRELTATLRATH